MTTETFHVSTTWGDCSTAGDLASALAAGLAHWDEAHEAQTQGNRPHVKVTGPDGSRTEFGFGTTTGPHHVRAALAAWKES